MNPTYNRNHKLFTKENLSTNDVLLKPKTGILDTRSKAIIDTSYIYSSPMDTVTDIELTHEFVSNKQNAVFCRFLSIEKRQKALDLFSSNPWFWYSVGSSEEDFIFLKDYFSKEKTQTESVNICVDVAHGDTVHLIEVYKKYASESWCSNLMSGTIANEESAVPLVQAGCTHLRIGIGPGSACSTRIVTGCGIPNLTAVFKIHDILSVCNLRDNVTLIADGGIKETGDIVKYLCAGADAVMLGSMLSTLKESAGWMPRTLYKMFKYIWFFEYNKRYYKYYRGQASYEFQIERRGLVNGVPEGVQSQKRLYPSIDAKTFLSNCNSAIASAISYLGTNQITDLNPDNVEFLKITQNGFIESKPHILL